MVRRCIGSAGSAFKDFFLLSFFDCNPEGDPAIWKKQDEENRMRGRGGGGLTRGRITRLWPGRTASTAVRASSLKISTYVRRWWTRNARGTVATVTYNSRGKLAGRFLAWKGPSAATRHLHRAACDKYNCQSLKVRRFPIWTRNARTRPTIRDRLSFNSRLYIFSLIATLDARVLGSVASIRMFHSDTMENDLPRKWLRLRNRWIAGLRRETRTEWRYQRISERIFSTRISGYTVSACMRETFQQNCMK